MGFLKGSQMLQQNCEHNKLYIFWKYGDWSFLVFPDTVNILKRQQSSLLYTDIVSFFSLAFFFAESLLPFQPLLLCLMHSAAGDPTTSVLVLQTNSICWQEENSFNE